MNRAFINQFVILTLLLFFQSCKNASSLTSSGLKNPSLLGDNTTPTPTTTTDDTISLDVITPNLVEINQCVPLIISNKNSSNNNVVAPGNLSIQIQSVLTPLYSDSACTSIQTSPVSFAQNALSKIIYVKPTVSQGYVFEMKDLNGLVASKNFILSVTNPAGNSESLKLALSGSASITAGQCRSYVVSLQNTLGASSNAASNLNVTLSGGSNGVFHAGTNCAGGAISSVTIASGSSFTSFSYTNNSAENMTFVADSPSGSSIQSGFFSVQVNAISGSSPTELILSGPSSVTEGACSGPVVVRSVDSSFNSSVTSSNLNFTLTGGAGFSVFSDAGCSNALASPRINANTSSTSFYFIAASAGNFVIAADDNGPLTDGSLSVQATATAGSSAVKLSLTGPASVKAMECSAAYTVKTTNGSGIESPVNTTTAVAIAGKGTGDFYSDSACTSVLASLSFASGDSSKSFYYKGNSVANLTFNVDDAGALVPSSMSVAITADVPTKLILSGPTPITLGDCRVYTVTSKDANDFVSSVTSSTSINLTGAGTGSFYTDSACSSTTSSIVINSGQSAALFYFKAIDSGSVTLSADNSGGLTTGTKAVTINPLSYTKVALAHPSLVAGVCSALTVSLKDSLNNLAAASGSPVSVNLSATGSSAFYSASNCVGGSLITSASISVSQTGVTVYVKDAVAENITLGATSAGLTSDSWNASVVAAANNTLTMTGPSTNSAGSCTVYDLRLEDSLGNLSPAASSTSVNFTGLGSARLYSDLNCTTVASSITIPSGSSVVQVYFKGSSTGSYTIAASSGSLTPASKSVSLISGTSNKLVINGSTTAFAGACTALSVEVQDSLNNPVTQGSSLSVTLSGNGGGSFYSNAGCTVAASSATVATSSSSANIWFKSNIPASLSLSAQAAGLFDGTKTFTINPNAPTKLVMTGSTSIIAGVCAPYSISLEDTLNNLSAAGSVKTLNFSGGLAGAFYSDSSCTTSAASISITSTQTSAQIYYKSNVAQTPNLTVDDSGLPDLTSSILPITVTSNAATTAIALKISGASSISTDTCIPYAVMTTDTSGILFNVASNVSVTLAGGGSGTFYSDDTCSTSSSTVIVGSGTSLSYIYYKSASAQNLVFSATATNASATTFPIAVVANTSAVASRLTVAGSTAISTDTCIPYVISVADVNGNSINATSSTSVTLAGKGSGDFYTNNTCTTSASGSIIVSSGSSYNTVYYKNSSAQNLIFIAQSTGLSNGTLAVAITQAVTAAPIALKIDGSTSIGSNTCVPYAIMSTDSAGQAYNVTSNLSVNLSGHGAGAFHSDSNCTTPVTTTTIASGASLSYVYYLNSTSQNLVFSATSAGANATTLPVAVVNNSTSVASRLTIAGSTSIQTNSCIPYVISVADANGNSVNAATNTTVTFAGLGSGDFYTDNACTTSASGSATISSGSSYTTLYYKNASVQNLILIAQSTGLSNGTLALAISSSTNGAASGPAVKLTFVAQPSSVASSSENFGVQPIVIVQDSNNNVASTASSTITLAAYTDSLCSLSAGSILAATSNPLNANGGVANFAGVNITSAQTVYLRASSPGLASTCSSAIQVYPSVASKLMFTTQPSSTATAGVVLSTQPQVSVLNYTNQVVTSATNLISITAYTDNACSVPVTGTFDISNGSYIPSSGVITASGIKYSLPTTIYLKAASAGLTSACSSGITVSPGDPYLIGMYTQPETSLKVAQVFSLAVRLYDSFGSLSPATHNLQITGYKSSNCTGATTSLTGSTTSSTLGTATFSSVSFSEVGTMSIKITDTTSPSVLSACTNAISVDGGTPTAIAISTPPSVKGLVYTTLETSPIFKIVDSYSHTIQSAINPVTLAAYTDMSCTTPASGTLFASSLEVTPSFGIAAFSNVSYSGNETIYLKATSPGLTSACSGAITISGMPKKIATRDNTTCAIVSGGVWCWGENNTTYRKLAHGYTNSTSAADFASTVYPTQVGGVGGVGYLSNISDISIGVGHVCALSTSGAVYCWGRNDYGQVGDNTTTNRATPTQVLGVGASGTLSDIVSISTGYGFSCAVNGSGDVYCWGYNTQGQLGDFTNVNKSTPVQVRGVANSGTLGGIKSVSGADFHVCALSTGGAVYCWGYNTTGQLGDNTGTHRNTPVQVRGVANSGTLANIISIATGGDVTNGYGKSCAVSSAGAVYCWGYGGNGEMGDNTTNSRTTPVQVLGVGGSGFLSGITSVSIGYYHVCALSSAGTAYCWGYNAAGQLGSNGTTQRNVPGLVTGVGGSGTLSNLVNVEAGGLSSCAVTSDGSMYCWGSNTVGQLGNQSTTNSTPPVKVKEPYNLVFNSMSTSYNALCATAREKIYCWGYNATGQLGDGTTTGRTTPALVSNLSGVKQVSMGLGHTCALLKTGEVYCWGANGSGQLGDATTTNRSTPGPVLGPSGSGVLSDIVSISAGGDKTCAVHKNGSLYCWGRNTDSELGDGTTVNKSIPTLVLSETGSGAFANVAMVSAGAFHTCALTGTGGVYCWGEGGNGRIGNNSAGDRSIPTPVVGLSSGVSSISAGLASACAMKNGVGYCWGSTSSGNAGSYTLIGSTPVVMWASGVTSVTAGSEDVCSIINKRVNCYNASSSYPYSAAGASATFYEVASIGMNQHSTGYSSYCALKTNGVIYCWGYMASIGLFNYGTTGNITFPSIIVHPTLTGSIHSTVATGTTYSCGNLNGIAQCWGASTSGALGSGLSNSFYPTPVLSASNSTSIGGQVSIGAGSTHTCSLSYEGEVNCWGDNTNGKLGNNSTVSSTKAVKVVGVGGTGVLNGVTSLGVGYRHSCATRFGNVYCWGYNAQGQLGIDSTLSMAAPYQTKGVGGVGYLTGATQVVSGRSHSCAIKSGNVYCWGNNERGQLGANTSVSQSLTPLQVVSVSGISALTNVTSITAGADHTCAIADGIAYCWGANTTKQLGNDSFTDSSYPVGVMNSGYVTLTAVSSITAGSSHTCATTSIGEVLCWGGGVNGQLGTNGTQDLGVATNVVGLSAIGNLSASVVGSGPLSNHTCAISTDQTAVYCWGAGASGQLGGGTRPSAQSVPTEAIVPAASSIFLVK